MVAIICVSVVTIQLGYSGDLYGKMIGAIVATFMVAQSYTDTKNGKT